MRLALLFLLLASLTFFTSCRNLPGVHPDTTVRPPTKPVDTVPGAVAWDPAPAPIASTAEATEDPEEAGDTLVPANIGVTDLPSDSLFGNTGATALKPKGGLPSATAAWHEKLGERRMFGPIYFAYNQSMIGAEGKAGLKQLADYLKKYPQFQVAIEGHCDERGSAEYNRGLGERRAMAVRDYLKQLSVDSIRMKTQSYGEEKPAVRGSTEAAYLKNRRAELFVYQPKPSP